MELGGNAPFLVFADADVDAAVDGAMLAKFRNVGEACTAANRFIVAAEVADEFVAKVTARVEAMRVGRGTEEGVQIGPLINQAARDKAEALVGDAVDRGAEVVVGGRSIDGPGTFYAPTVVTGVRPGSRILREEIFGPVLAVATFDEEEEGIRLANDTEYGLVAYAYTRDLARGMRLVDALQTGMVGLNTGVVSNAAAPFGGVKQSGPRSRGRARGPERVPGHPLHARPGPLGLTRAVSPLATCRRQDPSALRGKWSIRTLREAPGRPRTDHCPAGRGH